MADIDPTLMEQVFDIPKRERKSDIHHYRKLDDLGRRIEIAKRVLARIEKLHARIDRLKSSSADSARQA